MSAAVRLTSVRIFVDDLERAATFYEGVVGLKRSTTAPTAILCEDSPSIVVETDDDVGFETENAQALYADLRARGLPLHGPPEKQNWGGTLLFAEDPSGNTINFVEYPAAVAPGRGS